MPRLPFVSYADTHWPDGADANVQAGSVGGGAPAAAAEVPQAPLVTQPSTVASSGRRVSFAPHVHRRLNGMTAADDGMQSATPWALSRTVNQAGRSPALPSQPVIHSPASRSSALHTKPEDARWRTDAYTVAPWFRYRELQDVSVRHVAEQCLQAEAVRSADAHDQIWVKGELSEQRWRAPRRRKYHLFVSAYNVGAKEFARWLNKQVRDDNLVDKASRDGDKDGKNTTACNGLCEKAMHKLREQCASANNHIGDETEIITTTNDPTHINDCDFFLLYLTRSTWKKGARQIAP